MTKHSLLQNFLSFFHHIISKNKIISRHSFLKKIDVKKTVLEIGPFANPCLQGSHVRYFDVLNQQDLITRAKENNYPTNKIPDIDFVSSTGDLAVVNKPFENVFSSHCIEHQPDLVKHLQAVSKILKPHGKYYLIIPNKQYCFDALLPESTIADVFQAFYEKKTKHNLKSVVEHRALTTHNNSYRHWMGNHGVLKNVTNKIIAAQKEFEAANDGYVDVHAWQFTPDSFVSIIQLLNELHLIDLKVDELFHSPIFSLEFYVVLKKD